MGKENGSSSPEPERPEYESPLSFEIQDSPDKILEYARQQPHGYLKGAIGPQIGLLGKEPVMEYNPSPRRSDFSLRLPIHRDGFKSLPSYEVPNLTEVLQQYIDDQLIIDGKKVYRQKGSERESIATLGPTLIYNPRHTSITQPGQLLAELQLALRIHRVFATEAYKANDLIVPGETVVIKIPEKPKWSSTGDYYAGAFGGHSTVDLEALKQSIIIEDRPDVTFEQIGGQAKVVEEAKKLAKQLAYPEVFSKWGVIPPRGILFYGEPGNGKTLIGKALAHEANAAFVLVQANDIGSKWYGESEQLTAGVFAICRQVAKERGHCILFLDEVDTLVPSRQEIFHDPTTNKLIGIILQEIDGVMTTGGVTVVAATNVPENLDKAFLSRMAAWIEVPYPDEAGITEIFQIHFKNANIKSGNHVVVQEAIDFQRIASAARGASGRDIADIVQTILTEKAYQELEGIPVVSAVSEADIIQAIEASSKIREAKKRQAQVERGRLGFIK